MVFRYKALTAQGEQKEGTIEAFSADSAINQLQKTGLIISEIHDMEQKKILVPLMSFLNRVSTKDVVILSRQMSTLFQAQVSALRVFRLIGTQTDNPLLQTQLNSIADHIQGGGTISEALNQFPDTFSPFYINMVRSGEESGKLDEIFNYLADYLDRMYEVSSKARNALIYPAFVITTFVGVMVLMLTVIIPKIGSMITDSGQPVPFYTQIVLSLSNIFVSYGIFFAIALVIVGFVLWRYHRTEEGAIFFDNFKLNIPYLGDLYRKLYLSRIADNMDTMILSGIPILKALEITSTVVDNRIYRGIIEDALAKVKGGDSLSNVLGQYKEIPSIMTQMVKIGEETGELGSILKSLAKFYQREVTTAVDTLVSLIEPVMIVVLGVGVGILLAAVLMPIYNIAGSM